MSSVSYTGNGSQTDFTFSFLYLEKSHIKVYVNGVSTAYTWVNDGTVRVSPAPAGGTTVLIQRETPSTPVKTWPESNMITGNDLNRAQRQAVYIAEEARVSPNFTLGAVTTGAPGSSATVDLTGTFPNYTLTFTIPRGDTGAAGSPGAPGSGSGDVTGPASSVDNHLVLFSGTTGKVLKTSGFTITAFGQTVVTAADAAAGRTALGLGSLATLSAVPAATDADVGGFRRATNAEAIAGSANDRLMTPLRTAEAIAALSGGAAANLFNHSQFR